MVTGSYETAHDVVQEAFTKAIAERRQFRGEAPFGAWVWRIAMRVALDERSQAAGHVLGELVDLGLVEPPETHGSRTPCVDYRRGGG